MQIAKPAAAVGDYSTPIDRMRTLHPAYIHPVSVAYCVRTHFQYMYHSAAAPTSTEHRFCEASGKNTQNLGDRPTAAKLCILIKSTSTNTAHRPSEDKINAINPLQI